jgi:hypothetical protein
MLICCFINKYLHLAFTIHPLPKKIVSMKKILSLSAVFFVSLSVLTAQQINVSPKHFDKGKTVTFTFSGTNGMTFTQGTPSVNKLYPRMYILYTSASPTQGSGTSYWYQQGSTTGNGFFQDGYTDYWPIYQGTGTQGSPTQGTSTYCSFCTATSTLKSDDCMPEYDGVLSPMSIQMLDSRTITAKFDFPNYLSSKSLNIIFDNGEPCPYIMKNSIVMLGTDDKPETVDPVASVTIYPNPFSAELHFDFDQLHTGIRYDIVNIAGSFRITGKFSTTDEIIDLSHLPEGTYIVTVYKGQTLLKTEKFMKR